MIRRFCDICGKEIQGLNDGIFEERYTLAITDPANLSRLGGQRGEHPPAIEMHLRGVHNTDICRECLAKILIAEIQARTISP
jgi:hypothetical protein